MTLPLLRDQQQVGDASRGIDLQVADCWNKGACHCTWNASVLKLTQKYILNNCPVVSNDYDFYSNNAEIFINLDDKMDTDASVEKQTRQHHVFFKLKEFHSLPTHDVNSK